MNKENLPFRVSDNEITQFVHIAANNRYLIYTVCNFFPRKQEIFHSSYRLYGRIARRNLL